MLLMLTLNAHPEKKMACATSLVSVLGEETRALSALGKKPERARQTRTVNTDQPLAASTYYHLLSPLPNRIDRLAIINLGCNLHPVGV
jgi:hypothetical protein